MRAKEYHKMFELEDEHFWFVGKRLFIKSFLSPYRKKITTILDIGAGTAGTTLLLKNYGEVAGVETSPVALSLAKKRGFKLTKADAGNLPFKNKSFNLVTIFDVLYHRGIKSERRVLKEAGRVLKPGGLLLITDSAFEFLTSSHDRALGGKRRYTIKSLTQIVEGENFRVIRASYSFFSIFPFILIRRLLFNRLGSDVIRLPRLINRALTGLLTLEAFILKFINFPWGSSVIILAEKK